MRTAWLSSFAIVLLATPAAAQIQVRVTDELSGNPGVQDEVPDPHAHPSQVGIGGGEDAVRQLDVNPVDEQ